MQKLVLPENKSFIFTIFDDTDVATLENIEPVYRKLNELGIYTTKSVWPFSYPDKSDYTGSHTLQDSAYRDYIKQLSKQGFEIAFHNATMESSIRSEILQSLQYFKDSIGHFPHSYAAHALNKENIYWGENRFSFKIFRLLYRLLTKDKNYLGDFPNSKYFWGDLCSEFIQTVRTFTYSEINLLNITNNIFYRDPKKSYFNSCFITADADNVEEFNQLISLENQNKLEQQNGVCIISTHFGKGFVEDGELNSTTDMLLTKLAEKNGWFVPVSKLHDYYESNNLITKISGAQRFKLEALWFVHALKRKRATKSYKKTELNYLNP